MNKVWECLNKRINELPTITTTIILLNVMVAILTSNNQKEYLLLFGITPSHIEWGKIISASFLHDGFMHLFINMSLLYIFGGGVERAIGKLEFILLYVASMFVSMLVHAFFAVWAISDPYYADRTIVGSSGAIAGIIGFYAIRFHRKVFRLPGLEVQALAVIILWLLLQVGFGIAVLYVRGMEQTSLIRIGYWTHLGGFALGMFSALVTNQAVRGEREYLLEEARLSLKEDNKLEAAKLYKDILEYCPNDAAIHAELGKLWAILEEPEDSIRHYRTAIDLYLSQGQELKAVDTADEMCRFWPNEEISPVIRFRLASYLADIGDIDKAIRAFWDIIKENPKSLEAQMSYLKIGHLQLTVKKDPSSALQTLKTFIEKYPKSEWLNFAKETIDRAALDASSSASQN